MAQRRIDPERLAFADHPSSERGELLRIADTVDDLRDHVAVLRRHPDYAAPRHLAQAVFDLADRSSLLAIEHEASVRVQEGGDHDVR